MLRWLLLTVLAGHLLWAKGQEGYKIVVRTTKPVKDTACIVAYHFGDRQLVLDTFAIKKRTTCIIEGDTLLRPGVYIVYYPQDTVYVEMLVPREDQTFQLTFDPDDPIATMKVKGSLENSLFYQYNQKALQLYRDSVPNADSILLAFAKDLRQKHPNTFFARLIQLMYTPHIPDSLTGKDQEVIWRYVYRHYFDNVDLSDEALLRTPVLHRKVMLYLDQIVPLIPDSQCKAAVRIIKAAQKNPLTFKYWAAQLLNKYARSRIMGMENVYVCIVDSFYARGLTPWVDSTTLSKILFDAQMIKYTMIGKVAPEIVLKDTAGRYRSLHEIPAKYTVLIFWDPDCGVCRREMPKLKKLYEKYKQDSVEVYAVYVNVERDKWIKYIREHQLDWINVEDVEMKHPFRYYYYIKGTPKIYLLDRNKRIIAKNITVEQLDQILARRLGKTTDGAGEHEIIEVQPEGGHH